ncbi:MAG: sodium:calcium antiporter [Alphaproteobacteria bacterium]|nr:sodium:calcium antiporter [Alphaproteobacteria bacterium]
MFLVWTKFLVCACLIGLAGPVLTRNADIIARRTGVSRSWIGLFLLATATSLPELLTGVSAVAAAGAPNIAVGDALGSCVFNLVLLVFLDAMHREAPMYSRMDPSHILTAGFGIILIGFVGASVLLGNADVAPGLFHVGISSLVVLVVYFIAMRSVFVYEGRRPPLALAPDENPHVTLRMAVTRYLAAAVLVVGAGAWLPFVGLEIAEVMGWGTTFVGTLLIAGATSLPELVVTISALRLGSLDMAIANLLGSNLFDALVIAIDDLAYVKGPLLSQVSPVHAVTAFAAVIMSGIVIVSLLYRPASRFRGTIGWTSLSLLVMYFASTYAVYLYGGL